MIKEKTKKTKYNYKKSKKQVFLEYFRTIAFSVLLGAVVTTSLAIHARNEMVKNIFMSRSEKEQINREKALELIKQTDLLKDLKSKNYSICMHVGDLYYAAGDYKDAQIAYEIAISKAKLKVYTPYYKLICSLVAQENFKDAERVLDNIVDIADVNLIKFKTRSYLTMGDKYNSIGKFLSAAKCYEKAEFYYSKFSKIDKTVYESIRTRAKNSYIEVADVMVKSGLNTEAVRFLKKAEEYDKEDFNIRYKMAIILSDLDPEKSVDYFEPLLEEAPQNIDYNIYTSALMKAANIADWDQRPTKAKYYRYRIHSLDNYINRKVVYKNDVVVMLEEFLLKKKFFKYPLNFKLKLLNISSIDVINLSGDFVLTNNGKAVETITLNIANRDKPFYSNAFDPLYLDLKFKKTLFTKKDLENYSLKVYLYKDKRFKTLLEEIKIPSVSFVDNDFMY
ncbi:MAG: hypothetical protein E7Z89_06000 [Cyanobacteria bacterium SIG28]|nr:hypothetical protein [Cyanobacteria bacterium SIG28]